MRSIYAVAVATSPALLAACEGGRDARPPTQAEEIAAFCNQLASDFAANPSAPRNQFIGRMNRKILEKEWDPDTVANACSEALNRKAEFIRRNTQAAQNGVQ